MSGKRQNSNRNKESILHDNKWMSWIIGKSTFLSQKYRRKKIQLLFDNQYYRNQLQDQENDLDLIAHFCSRGWRARINPHPLFDVSYYLDANPDVEQAGANPLLHFLEFGAFEKRNPHPLFDVSYYLSINPDVAQENVNPLLHYLETGVCKRKNPHPLFEAAYYLTSNPDVEQAEFNPLLHYLESGAFEKRNPHPLFDADYYSKNFEASEQRSVNFLLHYINEGAAEGLNPHPGFETDYYKNRYLLDKDENPLINYLQHPFRKPSSWFTPYYYLNDDDLNLDETNPLVYALYDIRIPRCPAKKHGFDQGKEEREACESITGRKPLLYIVSHDATRTGAPAIILNIARHLSYSGIFEIVIFMHRGGPLLDEFKEVGDVICLEEIVQLRGGEEIMDRAMQWYCRCKPVLAIVNSMESSYFASFFGNIDIPVLMLIHEFVTSYEKDLVAKVIESSTKIVFPSQFVKDIAAGNFAIDERDYTVIPQGLLSPGFGNIDVSQARDEIRKELGVPPDAFVVLGCGSMTIRKGPDLFLQAAAAVKRAYGEDDIYFVWVGGPAQEPGFTRYLERDIDRLEARGHTLFVGEKENVEPYFVGADVFLLTSREDPFPCVVHEAMAASLPIVFFKDSGGAAEAVGDAGIGVPFGDIRAVSETIFKLYLNSSLRKGYGTMAKQRVHTHFNFSTYCSLLADYIKSELGVDMNVDTSHLSVGDTSIAIPFSSSPGEEDAYYYSVETQLRSQKRVMSRPVFIAGPTRSGTSIMKLVLRRIFGDFSPHEGHLWPLYRELHEGIDHYFDRYEDYTTFPTTLFQAGRETVKNAICNVFDSFHLDGSVKGVFVEKSPDIPLVSSLPLIQSMYPGARIIFMKRHGVDNIESKQRRFPEQTFENHCLFWKETMEEWLNVRKSLNNFIEVDQGRLLLSPEECSEQVADFLGLTEVQKEEILALFKEKEIEKTSSETTVHRKLSETSWSDADKECFVSTCGAMMAEYGYDY